MPGYDSALIEIKNKIKKSIDESSDKLSVQDLNAVSRSHTYSYEKAGLAEGENETVSGTFSLHHSNIAELAGYAAKHKKEAVVNQLLTVFKQQIKYYSAEQLSDYTKDGATCPPSFSVAAKDELASQKKASLLAKICRVESMIEPLRQEYEKRIEPRTGFLSFLKSSQGDKAKFDEAGNMLSEIKRLKSSLDNPVSSTTEQWSFNSESSVFSGKFSHRLRDAAEKLDKLQVEVYPHSAQIKNSP